MALLRYVEQRRVRNLGCAPHRFDDPIDRPVGEVGDIAQFRVERVGEDACDAHAPERVTVDGYRDEGGVAWDYFVEDGAGAIGDDPPRHGDVQCVERPTRLDEQTPPGDGNRSFAAQIPA